jgi:hypothetical protein
MRYDIAAEQVSQQGRNGHDIAESSSTVFVFILLSMSNGNGWLHFASDIAYIQDLDWQSARYIVAARDMPCHSHAICQ